MPMLDELLGEVKVPPPIRGVQEGLDPALVDQLYSPLAAPDLLNFRVAQGRWETRLGHVTWQALGGSGPGRLLSNYYSKSGTRIRLAARGTGNAAVLYDFTEGVDSVFQSVSGGTGLGSAAEPYFQIEYLQDKGYLTDRAGTLFRYDPLAATELVAVTPVAAPTAAPGFRTRAYATLEDWSTIGSTWAQSDVSKFELTDATATNPSITGRTGQMRIKSGAALNQTVSEDITAQALPSHTIAFWISQEKARTNISFGMGINAPREFNYALQAASSGEWWPVFVQVGDIGAISYKSFIVVRATDVGNMWVSSMVLPGNLEGSYRYLYTHYDSTLGRESAPSAISNKGVPIDLSAIGITNKQETTRAFSKSCALSFTSDAGVDATTDKIRVYRSGGVPELTKDGSGKDLWLRVATINDYTTKPNAGIAAADTTFTDLNGGATKIAAGDTLIVDKGVAGKEEYVHVIGVGGGGLIQLGTVGLNTEAFQFSHLASANVQIAYHDNIANEAIDVTQSVDIERQGPPAAVRFIRRSPQGRLWAFGYANNPTGVAISNLPTPDRPHDYETFPDQVDPNTRKSPIQGFRTQIGGDTTDEAIQWGGFYQGEPYAFTKKHLYVFRAQSQQEWGANAIQKVLNLGCINGDTVAEVNGVLHWVTDGPRVARWAGGNSPPEFLSHLKVNQRLRAAPTAYWNQWYAVYHAKRDGNYYVLYFTPAGSTTNTQRLDFLADETVWEPQQYKDSNGVAVGFGPMAVRDGAGDAYDLYQMSGNGIIYQTEVGNTDDGAPIGIAATTKKFALGMLSFYFERNPICIPTKFWLRLLAGAADSVTLSITCSGSEYGPITHAYPLDLSGAGEKEVYQRLDRDFRGRYIQFSIAGNVLNRPAIREMSAWYILHRLERHNA